MLKDDCYFLGYISKVRGLKGEVIAQLDVEDPSRYRKLETVYAELHGSKTLVQYTVKHVGLSGFAAGLRLEGIDTPEQAQELVRAQLYLPLSMLPPLKGKRFYLHEIPGFEVIDVNYGVVGTALKVEEFTHHRVLSVKNGSKEVLIPLIEGTVQRVDREGKKLYVEAPEGLIEIYLGDEKEGDFDFSAFSEE